MELGKMVEQYTESMLGVKAADLLFHNDQANVGNTERLVSIASSLGALGLALSKNRSLLARMSLLGLAGSFLYRGLSGECSLYKKLGISTCHPTDTQAVITKKSQNKDAEPAQSAA